MRRLGCGVEAQLQDMHEPVRRVFDLEMRHSPRDFSSRFPTIRRLVLARYPPGALCQGESPVDDRPILFRKEQARIAADTLTVVLHSLEHSVRAKCASGHT